MCCCAAQTALIFAANKGAAHLYRCSKSCFHAANKSCCAAFLVQHFKLISTTHVLDWFFFLGLLCWGQQPKKPFHLKLQIFLQHTQQGLTSKTHAASSPRPHTTGDFTPHITTTNITQQIHLHHTKHQQNQLHTTHRAQKNHT